MEGTPKDVAGTNNPSATNAISYVSGKVGLGVTFGNGGYIDIPDSVALGNQTFSFLAWAKPNGPGPGGPGEDASIIIFKDVAQFQYYGLFWDGLDSHFYFPAGNVQIMSAHSFPAGSFYHIAGTYNGSTFKLYVNGSLEGQVSSSQTIIYDSSIPWTIGADSPYWRGRGYLNTFNGVIDEVAVFNRALSSNEVAAIYAAGSNGMCIGMRPQITSQPQSQVGYWGQSVTFSVAALPISPPLSYQWQSNSVPISGATNQTLTLTNLQNSFATGYTVVVSNPYGSVTSAPPANLTIGAAPVVIALYPGVKIDGVVGLTYGIQYSTNMANTNGWIGLTNLTFTVPTEIWYDAIPASLAQRFYRVMQGPIPIP